MGQPVQLSDHLLVDARRQSQAMDRSLDAQIEVWARLGRALEPLLHGEEKEPAAKSGVARRLSECLAAVDTPEGRRRVADYLQTRPFPHYEPASDAPGMLVRISADGRRTLGRFVNREFIEAE